MYFHNYRNMKHPNIINFLGYSMANDEVILVTNFIRGSNLEQILFGKHSNNKVK